jgi:hypothetical protein
VRNRLIIFSRYPSPGKVKTRLIPVLGPLGTARLQRDMTSSIIKSLSPLMPEIQLEVHTDNDDMPGMRKLFGEDLEYRLQGTGDIGNKMHHAFSGAFEQGAERVVLIGSDCPFITPEIINDAFGKLQTNDCVLGPAFDGGYYLIAMKKTCAGIFKGITWGGSLVLDQTLAKTQSLGLKTALLERLHDIDRAEDIKLWQEMVIQKKQSISIIIAALNEEQCINNTVKRALTGNNVEVIVIDGGSLDKTAGLAGIAGAAVIRSEPGRAHQMNEGAKFASGEILLCLHADTILPEDYDEALRKALLDPRIIAGAFGLRFDSKKLPMRIIQAGANLRSRFLGLPYGDQGIFIRKADFIEAGGFPELPIMDDAVFVSGLKEKGSIITLDKKVCTSARRYERLGVLRTWLINQCVITAFFCGAAPQEISDMYRTQEGLVNWVKLIIISLLDKTQK